MKVIYLSKGVTRILIQRFVITREDLGFGRGKRGQLFFFDDILYYIQVQNSQRNKKVSIYLASGQVAGPPLSEFLRFAPVI